MLTDDEPALAALAPLAEPRSVARSALRLVLRDARGAVLRARSLDAEGGRAWREVALADDHLVVVVEDAASGAQLVESFELERGAPAGLQVRSSGARIATHAALREVVITTPRTLAVWSVDGERRGEWAGLFGGESALGVSVVVHVDEDLITVLDRTRGARRHVRNPRRRNAEVVSLDPEERHVDVVWVGGKVDRISLDDGHLAPLGHHVGARWIVSRMDRVLTASEHDVVERVVATGSARTIAARGPIAWRCGDGVLLGCRDGRIDVLE